ncbi:MAG: hypothetical protein V4585_09135 [Bacteroidota bacterium]
MRNVVEFQPVIENVSLSFEEKIVIYLKDSRIIIAFNRAMIISSTT